jgi:endoglucanase
MYIDQSEGGWETDPVNFSALMHTTIEEVGKRGMYCLIDAHIINPGDPYLYLESSLAFFDSMASKWGNKEHVIWEICNEPNGPNANWARIREYADPVIAKIREFDSANVIVVGTPGWSTLGDGAWTEIRDNQIDDINIMYTYHFYAATHGDGHRSTFTAASEFLPLFVTEFGIQEASGCGAITVEGTRAWWDLCYEKKVSWCNWSFSDFGDFDPSYPVSSAIMVQNACYGDQFDSTMLKPIGEKLVYHEVQKADNFEVGTEIVSRPSKKLQGTSKKITVENTGEAFVITGPDASTAVLRDLSGRTIATIKPQESGRFVLKRAGVSSGIGVISIENGSSVLTQKVILR